MQPLTFAVTIVSALSLYSLFFTIYRSRFTWNAAATALFLGLVELAARRPLRASINATIAFDAVDPQHALDRRPLPPHGAARHRARDLRRDVRVPARARRQAALQRGDGALARLADVPASRPRNSAVWLDQGLHGAPRRFAVLPERYDTLTQLAVPIAIVLAARAAPLRDQHRADARAARQRRESARQGSPTVRRWSGSPLLLGRQPRRLGGRRSAADSGSSATTTATTAPAAERANAAGKRVFASARLRRLPHARRRRRERAPSARTSTRAKPSAAQS